MKKELFVISIAVIAPFEYWFIQQMRSSDEKER